MLVNSWAGFFLCFDRTTAKIRWKKKKQPGRLGGCAVLENHRVVYSSPHLVSVESDGNHTKAAGAKSGQSGRGVHRLWRDPNAKSGQSEGGVHRLWCPKSGTGSECLRAVPRADRASGAAWSEREDHLAGPCHRSRLRRRLREREAIRAIAARRAVAGRARRDRDAARSRSAGGLRRGTDGAPPRDEEISSHAALPSDARLQPQVSPTARLEVELEDVGRAARARVSPTRGRHRDGRPR